MNFLKPESKPFKWKDVLKSDKFMRLAFMILLAGIIIAFMVILITRWQELFPTPTVHEASTSKGLPAAVSEHLAITPTRQSVTSTLPAPASITLTPPALTPIPFEGQLDNVEDYTPAKQDKEFNLLLEYVSRFSPEEISKQVNPDIKHSDLMEHPEKYRGEFVRVKGHLIVSPDTRNLTTNPAGLKLYYTGWLGDADKKEIYHFILIDRPEKHIGVYDRQGQPDIVWVEGVFLKLEKYERASRAGGGYKIAPLLIGRRMGNIPKVPVSTKRVTTLKLVLGGLIALAFIVIVIAIIVSARKNKAYGKRQKERWRKRITTDSTPPTNKSEP